VPDDGIEGPPQNGGQDHLEAGEHQGGEAQEDKPPAPLACSSDQKPILGSPGT